ncbi:MAG: phosphoglucosamine mutase, partial [Pseudomonadales bacterium]|nr:phosphoglucosamine mutase [Pseudomonadales bacterium]
RKLILIGKDTRISGYMFESALQAGLISAGVNVGLLGPMPTPAIAYLTRTFHAQAGIVISASHNPFDDNGIKFFCGEGRKLPDELEHEIEEMLEQSMQTASSQTLGKAKRITDAAGRYIEFCKSTFPARYHLKNLKIVVDCAHGATYHIAPNVFRELGAQVLEMGASPDGFNINEGCGSTQPEALQKKVVDEGADLGIALDGDGDRLIMVDEKGELLDGDELLFIIARDRQKRGDSSGVVGTLMTNLGFEIALRELGLPFIRSKVGDRYVIEAMQQRGWHLGGESSGHIICDDLTTTGDGLVAALQVLCALVSSEGSLCELKQGVRKFPQIMLNVRTSGSVDVQHNARIQQAVSDVESSLGNRGRVLLRPSGTEPVIRVMVEGEERSLIEPLVNSLVSVVEEELN